MTPEHTNQPKVSSVTGWAKSRFSKLPLIGHLTECELKDHANALPEIIVNLVWSTLPFWLGAIVLYATSELPDKEIGALFVSTFSKGELLVYSTSLLAPVFYMALHDSRGSAPFPSRLTHATLVAVVIVICAALFSAQRAGASVDMGFVFDASVWLCLFALFLRYLATLYNRKRQPDPALVIRDDEGSFSAAVSDRHEGDE